MTGIPTVTIRAWENRYQIINPTRSTGGHRLYSTTDINTLKWLLQQMKQKNIKISEAVMLLQTENTIENEKIHPQNHIDFIEGLYEQLIYLNTTEAHELIDLAFSLYHYEDVIHNIFVPLLYKIGEQWENGSISVAQEHFSSQFIIQRCMNLIRIFPINQNLPKVISFCPQGEEHHIGLMVFSIFLRSKGFDVLYLGANTPLVDVMNLIIQKEISIVAISITDPKLNDKVEKWVKENLEGNSELKVLLGGKGVNKHRYHPLVQCPSDWESWYDNYFHTNV